MTSLTLDRNTTHARSASLRHRRAWKAQHTGRVILVGLSLMLWIAGLGWIIMVWSILTLSLAFHEAGHAVVGSKVGYATRVRVGFGPLLWRGQIRGRMWDVRLLPLFGFTTLAFHGVVDERGQDASLSNRVPNQLVDIAVSAAGPLVNLLVGLVALSIALGVSPSGPTPAHTPQAGIEMATQATTTTFSSPFATLISSTKHVITAVTPLTDRSAKGGRDGASPESALNTRLDTLFFETDYYDVAPWRRAALGVLLPLGMINIAIGAINLVPGIPLDGYWILRNVNDLAFTKRHRLRRHLNTILGLVGVVLTSVLACQTVAAVASW